MPVFSHDHIEDFRATASHLVISVRSDDGSGSSSSPTWTADRSARCRCRARGTSRTCRAPIVASSIGYTFSDADLGESGGLESALFTASLKESDADAEPTPVVVTGAEPRVAEWRFVPDTDSILLLSFDGTLLLTGSSGEQATALGSALSIEGIARGSSEAIVERGAGPVVIDLSDAGEAPLVAARRRAGGSRCDHGGAGRRNGAPRRPGGRVGLPGRHHRRVRRRRRRDRCAD